MKAIEKKEKLLNTNFTEWIITRGKVEDELSEKQTMVCVCGKLATGMHERYCRKFQQKVDKETIKKLEHLIK